MSYNGIRRKVFLTFYGADTNEVNKFIYQWQEVEKVFHTRALGTFDNEDFIQSDDPDYVMSQIREKYIADSSVTIALLGSCTHSRRYVDWEIKASLTQSEDGLPNGLMAIILPSLGKSAHLPPRFKLNWDSKNQRYARFYVYPDSAQTLAAWIEDAFAARTSRAHLIENPREMMRQNATCEVHKIVHPAG